MLKEIIIKSNSNSEVSMREISRNFITIRYLKVDRERVNIQEKENPNNVMSQ